MTITKFKNLLLILLLKIYLVYSVVPLENRVRRASNHYIRKDSEHKHSTERKKSLAAALSGLNLNLKFQPGKTSTESPKLVKMETGVDTSRRNVGVEGSIICQAPNDYTFNPNFNAYYKFTKEHLTWEEHNNACTSDHKNSKLAFIESDQENTWLAKSIKYKSAIGLYSFETQSDNNVPIKGFKWNTVGIKLNYTNWASGYPKFSDSKGRTNLDCTVIYPTKNKDPNSNSNKWFNRACGKTDLFRICKISCNNIIDTKEGIIDDKQLEKVDYESFEHVETILSDNEDYGDDDYSNDEDSIVSDNALNNLNIIYDELKDYNVEYADEYEEESLNPKGFKALIDDPNQIASEKTFSCTMKDTQITLNSIDVQSPLELVKNLILHSCTFEKYFKLSNTTIAAQNTKLLAQFLEHSKDHGCWGNKFDPFGSTFHGSKPIDELDSFIQNWSLCNKCVKSNVIDCDEINSSSNRFYEVSFSNSWSCIDDDSSCLKHTCECSLSFANSLFYHIQDLNILNNSNTIILPQIKSSECDILSSPSLTYPKDGCCKNDDYEWSMYHTGKRKCGVSNGEQIYCQKTCFEGHVVDNLV